MQISIAIITRSWREHYFCDTLATVSHWRFVVLSVFGYLRSLLRIKIDFEEQNPV